MIKAIQDLKKTFLQFFQFSYFKKTKFLFFIFLVKIDSNKFLLTK